MRRWNVVAGLLVVALAGCGKNDSGGDEFSAYAISNTTLKGSFSLSRPTAVDAERQAIAACEAAAGDGLPCRQVLWFTEECGAIALGVRLKTDVVDWVDAARNGELLQIGNGTGPDAAAACADAARICIDAGGSNCAAREVACMDTGVVGACPFATEAVTAGPADKVLGFEYPNYIAYAYSATARSGVFSMSEQSAARARDDALGDCREMADGGDCRSLGTFEAECAAIAAAAGQNVTVAPGPDAAGACKAAEAECGQAGAKCSGVTFACASGDPGFCKDL